MVDGQHSARTLELICKRNPLEQAEQNNSLPNTVYIHPPEHTAMVLRVCVFKANVFMLTSCKYNF